MMMQPSYVKGRGRGMPKTDDQQRVSQKYSHKIIKNNGHQERTDDPLQSIFQNYNCGSDFEDFNEKTKNHIQKFISEVDDPCIVCLEEINRSDPIWSCENCYASYHLQCIQNWIHESLQQQELRLADDIAFPSLIQPRSEVEEELQRRQNQEKLWHCPTCRFEYPSSMRPDRYKCFCGKVKDPECNPWVLAHSCGETCHRRLSSHIECQHLCLLLCHPGPCPPCPQMVKVSCFCKKADAKLVRCGQSGWSCGLKCGGLLSCGQHHCEEVCHKGDCSLCTRTSWQRCRCGKERSLRSCAQIDWQCESVCSRPLDCGRHTCQLVCHRGDCGVCPLSGERTCPCGKSSVEGGCDAEVSSCHETCLKLLSCGHHQCMRKCHFGDCDQCKEMVTKTCKCGSSTAQIQCYKEFSCNTKCLRMRNCQRHQCKRKCCSPRQPCPPCQQVCNKQLNCRNHRCKALCHSGMCYPCTSTVTLNCPCGQTARRVPCGAERNPKYQKISCKMNCPIQSKCRHENRHACHDPSAICPRCTAICSVKLNCGHLCKAQCHEAVPTKIILDRSKLAGPWEIQGDGKIELIAQDCPPCMEPVEVKCLGDHEVISIPCSERREISCGNACGKLLSCGNHTCSRDCHATSEECVECSENCSVGRPAHCQHACPLEVCHSGPCPACTQLVAVLCHCGTININLKCQQYCAYKEDRAECRDKFVKLLSCSGPCPKYLDKCGHRCPRTCHTGPCIDGDDFKCMTKVTLSCPCGARKPQFPCWKIQIQKIEIQCQPQKCDKKKKSNVRPVKEEVVEQDDQQSAGESLMQVRSRRRNKRRNNRTHSDSSEDSSKSFFSKENMKKYLPYLLLFCLILIFLWVTYLSMGVE